MNKREVFDIIKRNGHNRRIAIVLIADFLATTKKKAAIIYDEEFIKAYT